jgi:hypothetical protein
MAGGSAVSTVRTGAGAVIGAFAGAWAAVVSARTIEQNEKTSAIDAAAPHAA